MLTVEDIKNVSFRRANFGGYKPEDVDAFIDDVQISFEQILEERERLLQEIKHLNERIDKFHEEDNSIKRVILNAQKIAEQTLENAKFKTTNMLNTAVEKSEKMIEEAKKKVSEHTEISNKLKEASSKLRSQLEDIYKKHMELIKEIPDEPPGACCDCEEKNKFVVSKDKIDIKDFKIDSSKNKGENSALSDLQDEEVSENEIFSSEELELPHRKFKDLKFGNNIDSEKDGRKNHGAYFGIFKKK